MASLQNLIIKNAYQSRDRCVFYLVKDIHPVGDEITYTSYDADTGRLIGRFKEKPMSSFIMLNPEVASREDLQNIPSQSTLFKALKTLKIGR